MDNSKSKYESLKNIKILLCDVDGVLTDGGLYYSSSGVLFKKFNVKDGMAVKLLHNSDIKCGVISSDKSDIIKARAEVIKMDYVLTGEWNKKEAAQNICSKLDLTLNNLAFIGDDVNDIPLLQAAGFSACPKDAVENVKDVVDFISEIKGGSGIFRQITEMILSTELQD